MKKFIIIGAIVILLPLIIGGGKMVYDEMTLKDAFDEAKKRYPDNVVKMAEKLFRWETAHFKSGQFKKTYSPGMEKHGNVYPWGWASMKPFWDANNWAKPVGWVAMHENAGAQADAEIDYFAKFPSFKAALFSVCEYIEKYGAGRWYSTNAESQASYLDKLNTIKNRYA